MHCVVDPILLFLDLDLGRTADADHRDPAREFRQALLELLAVIVGFRILDLRLDLCDPPLLQRDTHDLRRVDDASAQHVDIFLRLGVEAVGLGLVLGDLADHDRAFDAGVFDDLADRRLERPEHNVDAGLVWRAHIGDGQVQPFDPPTLNFLAKPCDCELGQLVRLEERNDRPRAPGSNCVEVLIEIPRPRSADREPIVLPRRQGDADFPPIGPGVDCRDLKRMGLTGSEHFFSLASAKGA